MLSYDFFLKLSTYLSKKVSYICSCKCTLYEVIYRMCSVNYSSCNTPETSNYTATFNIPDPTCPPIENDNDNEK